MKRAIFASTNGEKARHLHEFFKEGNRVTLDIIYTDNPYSPLIEDMKAEGVDVEILTPAHNGAHLAETLRNRNVELLVIDDFNGEIPQEVRDEYGDSIVTPTTAQSAPLDVISTADRINAALRNPHEETTAKEAIPDKVEATPADAGQTDVEQEWADALKVDLETPATNGQPPEYSNPQPNPQPPCYNNMPGQQNTIPPGYGYGYNSQNFNTPREPMPNTYLVWSVVISLLCCLIPGVIAIIYSASVSSKYYKGDIEGAKRASRNAQIWCIASIICGIIWTTLYVPLTLLLP